MLFIFGESEKGVLCRPTLCNTIVDLFQNFGHPPEGANGLFCATQTVLMKKPCVFFRVKEEGYSLDDYLKGLDILKNDWKGVTLQGIGIFGCSDKDVIEKTERLCLQRRSLILINQSDLFDILRF